MNVSVREHFIFNTEIFLLPLFGLLFILMPSFLIFQFSFFVISLMGFVKALFLY